MFLMLVAGAADVGWSSMEAYFGLLAVSALGALACRRAIRVLRDHGAGPLSRIGRAVMLAGIVVLSQAPVAMGDAMSAPVWLVLIGGVTAAVCGAIVSLVRADRERNLR